MRAIVRAPGDLLVAGRPFRAALGRGGIRGDKWEGDGATPTGLLPLRRVLYRPDRVAAPAATVAVSPITRDDGWCDDPGRAEYNRPVRLPFRGSAEALWRDDAVYDIIGVLGWNDDPVQPRRGSAIFLHVAHPDYAPTEGCIALRLDDLQSILAMGLTEIEVMG